MTVFRCWTRGFSGGSGQIQDTEEGVAEEAAAPIAEAAGRTSAHVVIKIYIAAESTFIIISATL